MVQALKGGYDLSINSVIVDIKAWASILLSLNFDYTPKALNWHAHRLAKFCHSIRLDVG